jgi:lysozyme family protein
MSTFELAIPVILAHEGGLVNAPDDPGGLTNFGITLKWWQSVDPTGTAEMLKSMSVEYAEILYRHHWWDRYGYGQILDQKIATKVFDMAVNMGATQAHKLVQSACGLVTDGILGRETLWTLNAHNEHGNCSLMQAIVARATEFYTDLAARKPELAKFLPGWLRRANWGA